MPLSFLSDILVSENGGRSRQDGAASDVQNPRKTSSRSSRAGDIGEIFGENGEKMGVKKAREREGEKYRGGKMVRYRFRSASVPFTRSARVISSSELITRSVY